MNPNFVPLDPQAPTLLGAQAYSFTIGNVGGLFAISSFVLFLFLVADGGAAVARILYALGLRALPDASEAQQTKARTIISTVLFSLLGSFSLVLLFLMINPDVVTGDVDITGIRVGGGANKAQDVGAGTTANASCPNTETYKQNLSRGGGVCDTSTCTALTGCDQTYVKALMEEATRQGVNPQLAVVIMCKESKGKPRESHVNGPNSIDCGLMQINKAGTTCTEADYDVTNNIQKGVSLIKEKWNSVSQTYPGITREMMVFASYNCCTTGNPNVQSADCTQATGFPTIPKWACPINPGQTSTNMCFVRNYVCDLQACLKRITDF